MLDTLEIPASIDLRPLKAETLKLLSPGDPLREAILEEPDTLPQGEALGKLEAYLRLALALRRRPEG